MANFFGPDPLQSTFFIPGSNTPGNGVQLFIYLAGSTTKTTVYKTQAGTAHTNPIVLDSGGNLPSQSSIWIPAGVSIKAVYAPSNDTDPPVSPYLAIDNISGINDIAATASQWVSGPTPTFVSPTQFTLVGDQTATFQVGRRIEYTVTAGTGYARISVSVFGALTTVTIVPDSIPLDSGLSAVNYALLSALNPSIPVINVFAEPISGRLTLSSGVAVTNTDIGSQTLYFTPYKGNTISLYDGAYWNKYNFSEASIAVPNTSNTVYDIFAYPVSSAVALSTAVWSNSSTRATSSALVSQNGVYVRTGDTSQRYLGTFATATTSGFITDSKTARRLQNYYNTVPRQLFVTETTSSWNNSSQIYRPLNGSTTNRVDFIVGLSETIVNASAHLIATATLNGHSYSLGIGLDSITSTDSAFLIQQTFDGASTFTGNSVGPATSVWNGYPPVGLHFLQWLERNATGSTVPLGNRPNGLLGTIFG